MTFSPRCGFPPLSFFPGYHLINLQEGVDILCKETLFPQSGTNFYGYNISLTPHTTLTRLKRAFHPDSPLSFALFISFQTSHLGVDWNSLQGNSFTQIFLLLLPSTHLHRPPTTTLPKTPFSSLPSFSSTFSSLSLSFNPFSSNAYYQRACII